MNIKWLEKMVAMMTWPATVVTKLMLATLGLIAMMVVAIMASKKKITEAEIGGMYHSRKAAHIRRKRKK